MFQFAFRCSSRNTEFINDLAFTVGLSVIQLEEVEQFDFTLIQIRKNITHLLYRFCISWQRKHQIRLLIADQR